MAVDFQPPASRRTAASVAMHCGAYTNHTSSDKAVARDHWSATTAPSAPATSSPVAESAYTVPSAATTTSRAAMAGISATTMRQSKPSGANSGASRWPRRPARLISMALPVKPSGGAG